MSNGNPPEWTPTEERYVGFLWATQANVSDVKRLHHMGGYPERSEGALSDARWKREGVREALREFSPDDLPANHPVLRELEREVTVLRSTISDLRSKLKEADKQSHVFQGLAEIARTEIVPFSPKVPVLAREVDPEQEGVAMVSLLSDLHADMVVGREESWGMEDYDFNVFRERFTRWVEVQIAFILDHLPRYRVEELWIFLLGDNVHGDIHNHGPFNYFRNTLKAAIATGDVVAEGINYLHNATGTPVRIVGVSGNHARRTARKNYDGPHDNFDYLVGVQVASRLREIDGVEVVLPNSWTAFVEVREKIWCLNHGDDVTGYAGFPWYGFSRKNNRIQALASRFNERVSYFVYGHYHTKADFQEGTHTSIHNGAFARTDPYALEKVVAGNVPTQRTFIVNSRGIILDIPIYVEVEEGEVLAPFGQETTLELVEPVGSKEGLVVIGREVA